MKEVEQPRFFSRLLALSGVLLLGIWSVPVASGDGGASGGPSAEPSRELAPTQRDPRLPPVIPGEGVGERGKGMRVWSTGGSVTAEPPSAPPTPSGESGRGSGEDISVIIDRTSPDQPRRDNPRHRRSASPNDPPREGIQYSGDE